MAPLLQLNQTLIGRTGTSYHLQKILYERKRNEEFQKRAANEEGMRRLWLALYNPSSLFRDCIAWLRDIRSNNSYYVVKPVIPYLYDQAFRLQEDLSFSPFVRLPVDGNDAHTALIFPHYTEDFLSFMQSGPVPRCQVKRILLDILKGIAACHNKDWVHCGNYFRAPLVEP